MIGQRLGRAAVVFMLLANSSTLLASPIPSKADETSAARTREADIAQVKDFLARSEVAKALGEQGLPPEAVEQRLAQLSNEDLRSLASNIEQVQAAGDVPKYIWILLAILIGVTILAAIF